MADLASCGGGPRLACCSHEPAATYSPRCLPPLYSRRSRWARYQLSLLQHRPARQGCVLAAVASDKLEQADPAAARGSNGRALTPAETAALQSEPAVPPAAERPLFVAPEDFRLPPGQLSSIDRTSAPHPQDVFRCAACSDPACEGPGGCASMQWRNEPGGYLREILTAKVYDVAVETPMQKAEKLSEQLGSNILLKREDLQARKTDREALYISRAAHGTAPVKSFKLRGAYNKMAQLSPEQLARGVICSSAGNHAQGVALGARQLGTNSVICMPESTPDIKVSAVRALGGTVELVGESYNEAQAHAQARAAAEGRVFIAPYDDPYTIAGQGTIGNEVLRQCKMDELDAIFVAVGGGGLVAGIAAYIKALKPHVKIIGVEPTGANAMAQSLAAGRRVTLTKVDAFADGVAVKYVGAETFRLCRELLDGVVLVDNNAISAAIKDVFNETRSILEPAGAVAVAGAKAYLKHYNLKGKTVVAVTSGANMNFDRLRLVAELADVGVGESMLAVTIPERPGTFIDFLETALNGFAIQVTEFKYRYSQGDEAHVLFGIGVPPGSADCSEVIQRLNERGYPTQDISDIELAQVHLRHLVGGRAMGGADQLPDEHIFQVDFPERPGALRKFLAVLCPRWNITLFHYRKTGNQASGVLLGMQVPDADRDDFWRAVSTLDPEGYQFTEISGKARQVFKMFIQ
ncbi:hypothetical protein N2152v2_008640 [Parachlorella kessleri]